MNRSLHEIIYSSIRDDISRGKYIVGEMLPSENLLSKTFKTTRMTVRNALLQLKDEGYLYTIPGKGYFVKEKLYNKYSFKFDETKIFDMPIDRTKLVSVDIIKPNVDLSYNLRLPGDSRIVAIKRLLFIGDSKVALDEKYIPYYSGIPIVESDLNYSTLPEIISNKESLFTIKKKLTIKIVLSENDITEIFNFQKPQHVFRVEISFLDDEKEPVGWSKITYLMDWVKIDAQLLINK